MAFIEDTRYGPFERAQDRAAYEGLRDRVLTRVMAKGDPIDLESLSEELDVAPHYLEAALVRLSSEFLVSRDDLGVYRAVPLTVQMADGLFDARTTIEIGVVDSMIESITAEDLAILDDLANQLASIVAEPLPDLSRFLTASHEYHSHLVGLARSEPLSAAYLRLGISRLWRSSIADLDWWNLFDVTHHSELTAALRNRDTARAKRLIYQHQAQVKQLVRDVITAGGGAL